MYIDEIKLYNYRNYSLQNIEFSQDVNVIYGANAQGKTNILEAMFIASNGFSHRNTDINDCIKWGEINSGVLVRFYKRDSEFNLKYQLTRGYGKKFYYNSEKIRASELPGILSAVMFSPEDLMMIKGAPRLRRFYIDQEISQTSKIYAKNISKLNKILQHRNNLLKSISMNNSSQDMLEEWDEQFAHVAADIVSKRMEAVRRISMLANLVHRKISCEKENLSLVYKIHGLEEKTSVDKTWYLNQLENRRREDIVKNITSIGPQRDDLVVMVNNYDCKNYGSQGQQRTSVLSLKLAEVEYIRSETGEYPVMLLDDVMSELDGDRQKFLLNGLAGKIQTFITTTDSGNLNYSRMSGKYIQISNGNVL